MPRRVEMVTTDCFDAYGGSELLEMLREDHPLTRELLARLKCFVRVGDGAWFMCSSGPTCTANGGVVGVWNVNGYDALLDYLPRMGRSVLEVPAIKQHMVVEKGEKKLWDKCMKYMNRGSAKSQADHLRGPKFGLTRYDFVELTDQNAALLCFSNGMVFDARACDVRKAQPEDYITKTIGVSSDELDAMTDAQAQEFVEKVLAPVFHPSIETLYSVLDILALTTFGCAKGCEKIFLLYGRGRNFKTKLTELMSAMLGGDHFKSINHSQVTSKGHDDKNPYLAGTSGARLVSMSELSKNDVLIWDKMKTVCSSTPINVRYLYQGKKDDKQMSFGRTYWPLVDSNFLPGIDGIGSKSEQYGSLIDRAVVIPFNNNFVDSEADNYIEQPADVCAAVGDSQFGENYKAVMLKVLVVRFLKMKDRGKGEGGPIIGEDGKLVGGKLNLRDLSDQIQTETGAYVDRLFDKDGKLCPLNDFELQKFRNQLEKMSNLSGMHNAPMVRSNAQRLPDDSSLSAGKDCILGHENSLENDSALLKKSFNPEQWRKVRLVGYELIMAELGLKKMPTFNGERGADGSQGKCMSGRFKTYEGSDQKYWLVYKTPE